VSQAWQTRNENPEDWDAALRLTARELPKIWGQLAAAWNPRDTSFDTRDRTDDMNMNEAEWAKFKRSVEYAQRKRGGRR
jgi:hypothetical protein